MKVLVITPQLWKRGGGVANYYKILRPYLSDSVEYFTACRREQEHRFGTALRLWVDYCNFKKRLVDCALVHLNPSLVSNAIIRDGLFLRAGKRQGRKVVVFFRGWNNEYERRLRNRWLWLFKMVYFKADAFIVLAEEFRKSLRDMGYNGPIFVETTVVEDLAIEYYESHSNLVKKGRSFNILFLTRIERTKGIYEAIETYKILKKIHRNLKLTIAGIGTELRNIKKYVRGNDVGIEFKGHVTGKKKLYTFLEADCYLFPSYTEGMPNSVLEAMALGLPVVTRPVGGLKDFFEDEKMGYITESLEPRVFADLIEKLILDTSMRQRIGQFNHQYAKERFLASKVARRLETIYDELLQNPAFEADV